MVSLPTLGLFVLAALALLSSPGPNMAFVLAQGAAHGRAGALAAAVGISAADLVLAACAAGGVTAAVAAWAPAFDLLRWAGAACLLWLGLQAWRSGGLAEASRGRAHAAGFLRSARMGFLQTLANPKALLFFLVFLPQFVQPERGSVALQMLMLGTVLAVLSLGFNTLTGILAGALAHRVRNRLRDRARAARWQRGLLASVMIGLAARLLLLERPTLR